MYVINPYRFGEAGPDPNAVTTPKHYWDLDDDNVWLDEGSQAWGMTENANLGVQTAAGPNSQDVMWNKKNNDYITTQEAWRPEIDAGNDYTITGWFYVTAFSNTFNVLFEIENAIQIMVFSSYMQVTNYNSSGSIDTNTQVESNDNTALGTIGVTGKWFFYAATRTGNDFNLYMGDTTNAPVLMGTGNTLSTTPWDENVIQTVRIGGGGTSATQHKGYSSMIGIWHEELTLDQITNVVWNNGLGAKFADLVINDPNPNPGGDFISKPIHWWDLTDTSNLLTGGLYDQGSQRSTDWDLTNNGCVTFPSSGPSGFESVLDFDSADYLDRTNTTWDGIFNSSFSFACWVNYDVALTNPQYLISWANTGVGGDRIANLYLDDASTPDEVTAQIIDWEGDSLTTSPPSPAVGITNGTWYHIVMTWENTTNTLRIYQNGVEINSASGVGILNVLTNQSVPFALGIFGGDKTSNGFDGKMWTAGIWDVALTLNEVEKLYNEGDGGTYITYSWSTDTYFLDNPLHWWDLDDTTNTSGGGLFDQGYGAGQGGWNLTNTGCIQSAGTGPNGQNVLDFDIGDYLDRSKIMWDGENKQQLSFSCWVNYDAIPAGEFNYLFSWANSLASEKIGFSYISQADPDYYVKMFDDSGASLETPTSTVLTSSGTWHHLTFTYNGETIKYYQDGIEIVLNDTGTLSYFETDLLNFALGTKSWDKGIANSSFDGKMFGVGIWDSVLTAKDIYYLYHRGTFDTGFYDSYIFNTPTNLNPLPGGSTVLYRLNCGSDTDIVATDSGGVNWIKDSVSFPSTYFTSGDIIDYSVPTIDQSNLGNNAGTVPHYMPIELLYNEKYDNINDSDFQYDFPVTNGEVEVRLYFCETWHNGPGLRKFHVVINEKQVLTNYDCYEVTGGKWIGDCQVFRINVTDSNITLKFNHGSADYPNPKGIEIIQL